MGSTKTRIEPRKPPTQPVGAIPGASCEVAFRAASVYGARNCQLNHWREPGRGQGGRILTGSILIRSTGNHPPTNAQLLELVFRSVQFTRLSIFVEALNDYATRAREIKNR